MALSWQTVPALCFSNFFICPPKDSSISFPSTPVPVFNERPPTCKNTPTNPWCFLFGRTQTPDWLQCSLKGGYCLTLSSPHSSQCSCSFVGIKRCKAAECQKCCRSEQKCWDSMGQLRDWNTKGRNGSCLRHSWNDVWQLWKRSCLNFCKQHHKVLPVWRTFPGRTQWITEHKSPMRDLWGSLFIYLLIWCQLYPRPVWKAINRL